MLYDEGMFELEDPITEWAPEFRDMKVLSTPEGDLADVVPAGRPITFADLLTHRSGLTYGAFHTEPIRRAYYDALGPDIDSPYSPDTWIARLAMLPLIDQPGRAFHYGVSTDLLGFLVSRMTGKPLGQFLHERIFSRLGMNDTSFDPPLETRDRVAKMYSFDAQGRLEHRSIHPQQDPAFLAERPQGTTFVSGSGGLWSTVDDYLRFARVFVEEGAVGGQRLLKLGTVRRMMANSLTDEQRASARIMGVPVFTGHGFGLGLAVVLEPEKAAVTWCKGGIGTVGWPGAFGGWWQADPTDGSVMVFLAHNAVEPARLAQGMGLGVYAATTEFHAMGTTIAPFGSE
jgi:CubicO group peptidase (beta-lactamase class C family)